MDVFENALQYLADKLGRGPTPKASGSARVDMGIAPPAMAPFDAGTIQYDASPDNVNADMHGAKIAAEVPLRIPSQAANVLDLIPRMIDAHMQPDYVNVEPKEGEVGPNVRKVGKLEAFGQAEFGTRSADDVRNTVREILLKEVQQDPSLAHDDERLAARAKELVDAQRRPHRAFIKDVLEDDVSRLVGNAPDAEKTMGERLLQTGLGAMLPNPALPGRVGNIASELLMPGVNAKNYTGLAVGLNTGLSVGAQAAIEHLVAPTPAPPPKDLGDGKVEVVLGGSGDALIADTQYEDHITEHEKVADAHMSSPLVTPEQALPLFVAIAGVFNPRAAAKAGVNAAGNTGTAASAAVDALKATAAIPPNVTPKVNEFARTGANVVSDTMDELAPIERTAKKAGIDPQEAVDLTNEASQSINGGVHQVIAHAEATGELPNSTLRVLPIRKVKDFARQLRDNDMYDAFQTGIMAKTELRTRQRYLNTLTDDISSNQRLWQAAQARGDARAMAGYQKAINEAQDELQKLMANVNVPGMSHLDWQTLRKAADDFDQVPMFKDFHAEIVASNRNWAQWMFEQSLISRKTYDNLINEAEYYIPRMHDPLMGKTGLARAAERGKQWLTRKFDVDDAFQEKLYTHAESPHAARQFDNGAARVEAPMRWDDALSSYMEHTIRHAQYQRFVKTVVDGLRTKAGANVANVMDTLEVGGKTMRTRENWSAIFNSDKGRKIAERIDSEKWIPVSRGDNVEYVRFKDPMAHAAVMLPPSVSGPLLRMIQKVQTPFRQMTTGRLSPFQAMSAMFDASTINITRPVGSVYGIDYAALKVPVLNNIPAYRAVAAHLGRTVDNLTLGQSAFALNLGTALQTFTKTYGNHVAAALAGDLTQRSPLFKALGDVAPQFVDKIAHVAMDKYKDSLFNLAVDNNIAHNVQYERMLRNMREIDTILPTYVPKGARILGDIAGAPFLEAWNMYKHAVSAIESAGRVGYMMRNIEMEAMKYGGDWRRVPKPRIERIMRDARTLGGDFNRRAGRNAQAFTAVTPYLNVQMKTMRAMYSRLFDHSNPATTAYLTGMFVGGVVVPRLMSDMLMTSTNDQLRDWWYNKMPEWQREQLIMFPKPHTWDALLRRDTDAMAKLTKDDFYQWVGLPEGRPIASAVSGAMRAFGMYNEKGNVSSPMASTPFGQMMSQTLGVGAGQAFAPVMPPALNAMFELAGTKFDFGKALEFQSPLSRAGGVSTSGAYDMLNVSSSIPRAVGDFIATMFGPGGARLTQAFDTGVQVYEQNGGHYLDALASGANEFAGRFREGYGRFDTPGISELDKKLKDGVGVGVPFVGSAADKVYRRTSSSDTVKAIRDVTSLVSGRQNAFGKEGTGDVLLDDISADIKAFAKDGDWKELSETWKQLNDDLMRNEANKTMPYAQRNTERIQLTRQLQDVTTKQAGMLREMEEEIKKDWGLTYKTKYGTDFTWQHFGSQLNAAKRKNIKSGEQ